MGWGNCGTDSKGREIGYHHMTSCDQDGCEAEIDRGTVPYLRRYARRLLRTGL